MYIIRRWWERHALPLVLVSLALGTAWTIRQTQGGAIFEIYQVITSPLELSSTKAERLSDAKMLELQAKVVELESQNQKLKQLLGYIKSAPQAAGQGRAIAAPVVGRSADHWWQQVTLGRGSNAGIEVGFIVSTLR